MKFLMKLISLLAVAGAMLGAPVIATVLSSPASAQTSAASAALVSLPAATAYEVKLTYVDQCSPATSCSFIAYRMDGSCPASPGSQASWLPLPATAAGQTVIFDDNVSYGSSYCYAVEAEEAGANSGPSNLVGVTIPGNPPPAPTGAAAAAAAQ